MNLFLEFVIDFLASKNAGAKLRTVEIKQIAGGKLKQRPREIKKKIKLITVDELWT